MTQLFILLCTLENLKHKLLVHDAACCNKTVEETDRSRRHVMPACALRLQLYFAVFAFYAERNRTRRAAPPPSVNAVPRREINITDFCGILLSLPCDFARQQRMTSGGESDVLFEIRTALYLGNYQQCINEAQKLKVTGCRWAKIQGRQLGSVRSDMRNKYERCSSSNEAGFCN